MNGYLVLDPTNYLGTDDDEQTDQQRALARIMSPVPADQLVTPRTGVSNPPQDQISTSSGASVLTPAAAGAMQPRITGPANSVTLPNGANVGTSMAIGPQGAYDWMKGMDNTPSPQPMQTTSQPALGPRAVAPESAQQPLMPAQGPITLQPAGQGQHGRLLRILGDIGDAAISSEAPNLAQFVPHTSLYKARQTALQQERDKNAAAIADTRQQIALRQAEAEKNSALADADKTFPLDPKIAAGLGHPEWDGLPITQRTLQAMQTAKQRLDSAAGHDQTKITTTDMNNQTSLANNQNTNKTKVATNAATNTSRETIAEARNKTNTLLQGMRDATSAGNNQRSNATHIETAGMRGGTGNAGVDGSGNFKVPGFVATKAALARNVQENAKQAADIIQRRPDLIGKFGGSVSQLEELIGNDDSDLSELATRLDNIIKASNGVHSLRGKYALEAGQKILGQLRNGPNAFRGALKGTTDSVQTFIDDENNYRKTGSGARPPAAGNATHVITMKNGTKVNARVSPDGRGWVNAQTGKPL